jgi:hypothetical protein
VLRMTILQAHTPRALMGRLSGSFFAAAIAGNRVGDGETGGVAALAGPQVAVWTGGLACIAGTLLLAWRVPGLWRHDTPASDHQQPAVTSGPEQPAAGLGDVAVEGA